MSKKGAPRKSLIGWVEDRAAERVEIPIDDEFSVKLPASPAFWPGEAKAFADNQDPEGALSVMLDAADYDRVVATFAEAGYTAFQACDFVFAYYLEMQGVTAGESGASSTS